ncbi:MAG: ABC-type transport auxiliary lipoprotein family protein [Pseudomonadota bacterium]|jgi:cholesterol transport system auxiliary component|uniref:ABC-type transport auxiliary lipoprotein family protein n=1 Tax=Qipengyuania flava TaxID=192812 RepID=UPI000ED0E25E|nr:ABC-type transport auxiliary lipoprotein family protein [Qipengyuania flava]MEC7421861.1 ABC-type transport auxiliary lipoprotein family protein [Pseudomonadota bacterium]HCS18450.1 ABC transporter [Erythrobacter sp.]MCA0889613.1 ABC-type transport auxiliary lipoprotein family protein [Qipengyuania flava]MEC7624281.1 ABC-type transport auxiliary lipoprotein family protein [Pseudomonadota bacterium]MEC8714097.1 ABC-type transport auxiliary lipoprotein family protein [Pseudomonadota bacterium
MTRKITLAALAPALLLGGCVSFGGDAPDSLLTLTPSATAPAGVAAQGAQGSALAIVPFEATKALDVTRVPVQVTDTELAYLQDAVWVDRPARLFGQLVAETIRSRSGRVVVDGDDPGVNATDRLHGSLRSFGYDARSREAVVVFDAVRNGDGSAVVSRRFEARVAVAEPEAGFVGPALNRAANQVAGEVAEWIG